MSFFWSNLTEVPEMVEQLGDYPFTQPLSWTWGFDAKEGTDVVLALSLTQIDRAGRLEAAITIADQHDLAQRLTAKFTTDYASVGAFRSQLAEVLRCRGGEARLSGFEAGL